MQSLAKSVGTFTMRSINFQHLRFCALPMSSVFNPGLALASDHFQQRRFYDKERKYNYTDRRYEREIDYRYDKPSGWTLHPLYKVRVHLEEHSSMRAKSVFVVIVMYFGWLAAFLLFLVYGLPYPEGVGGGRV